MIPKPEEVKCISRTEALRSIYKICDEKIIPDVADELKKPWQHYEDYKEFDFDQYSVYLDYRNDNVLLAARYINKKLQENGWKTSFWYGHGEYGIDLHYVRVFYPRESGPKRSLWQRFWNPL